MVKTCKNHGFRSRCSLQPLQSSNLGPRHPKLSAFTASTGTLHWRSEGQLTAEPQEAASLDLPGPAPSSECWYGAILDAAMLSNNNNNAQVHMYSISYISWYNYCIYLVLFLRYGVFQESLRRPSHDLNPPGAPRKVPIVRQGDGRLWQRGRGRPAAEAHPQRDPAPNHGHFVVVCGFSRAH